MFTLPKLEYSYDALEPYIDTKTMEIHHTKHHQAYVDKLNKALESEISGGKTPGVKDAPDLSKSGAIGYKSQSFRAPTPGVEEPEISDFDNMKKLETLLANLDKIPEEIKTAVRNNAGGHYNHSFFWQIMTPADVKKPKSSERGRSSDSTESCRAVSIEARPEVRPQGDDFGLGNNLEAAITNSFGSFENFKKEFSEKALSFFGSGWVWLVAEEPKFGKTPGLEVGPQDVPRSDLLNLTPGVDENFGTKKLQIITTPNQDSPISQNLKPILCLDLWEHSFYLKWQHQKNKYIESWWNIINWQKVEENYLN
ncbi:MAG: Superoxide dismutase [Candidatus Nomurabacteria bacterium GW2011_GWB1_37_5]|uniref:superoxide dismutase n=1 Tax=Candidatus Nomurabacteria bacterium GW2011_GWB1_37_5 TaxID=1618742 RepID=A0A0G0JBM9_9BACT|nr:MAG: Superoxide dismutase [Candidatus Nomurabacteria bacterium GW2011_GWB1_37_5]